jgi:Arc/MetJ-type ribon-helix-helix transcriptional regulator
MTKQTTIHLEASGPRRSLQIEESTERHVADLVTWGYGKNLTEVVRQAAREAWERQWHLRTDGAAVLWPGPTSS